MDMDNNPPEALILAGGLGTRLRSVVSDRPKPMAGIAGHPFLELLILSLKKQGIKNVILCTGYMGGVVETYFGDGSQWGVNILYSPEKSSLGTGGAIRLALGLVSSERFIVLNGDSYCRFNLADLFESHLEYQAKATLWLVPVEDCRRYGSVIISSEGEIEAFKEKSSEKVSGLINAGVYLLEKEIFADIPVGQVLSIEKDLFPQLIGQGLHAVVGTEKFIDIGTPESYALAEQFFAEESLL